MNLAKSQVTFDEEQHRYFLGERELSGITPIVHWLFPSTYDGISEDVLHRAAEYGKDIHHRCNMLDLYGIIDDHYSVTDYKALKEQHGLKAQECEYLVSDNFRVASAIDVILTNADGNIVLGDIKTTSRLLTECVTLQLSIYAYLFERQNPALHVSRLMCMWLPKQQYGKSAFVECKRASDDLCERIISAYIASDNEARNKLRDAFLAEIGLPATVSASLPDNFRDAEVEVARIEREMKAMKERSDELRAGLLALMQQNNVKKWDGEHVTLTRKLASTRTSLDQAKLKADYPEAYAACLKESTTSESLIIKVK